MKRERVLLGGRKTAKKRRMPTNAAMREREKPHFAGKPG